MKLAKGFLCLFILFIASCTKDLPEENKPPVVNAGADISQTLTSFTQNITLNGSASDEDGNITGYVWNQVSGPNKANIITPGAASTQVNGLVTGRYEFQLMASDNDGAIGVKSVAVTITQNGAVQAENAAPVVHAGNDTSVTLNSFSANITLKGTATDADGNVTAYSWTQTSGPNKANIVNSGAAQTSVNGLISGAYQFMLAATDNKGAVGVKSVTITIQQTGIVPAENIVPVVHAGNDTSVTLSNFTDKITLKGSATDADGTISSYSWEQVSGPNTASIGSSGAAATDVQGLITGTYQFRLSATDNKGATGVKSVTLTVVQNGAVPAENKLPVVNAGNNMTFTLTNATGDVINLSGSATDPDGTISSFLWSKVSGPSTVQFLNAGAAATSVSGVVAGVYGFQLMATDNKGATASKTVTITIIDNRTNGGTLVLQPANNTGDASLAHVGSSNYSDPNSPEILAAAWTNGGTPHDVRALLRFDLSGLPANATITSARLYLYSTPNPINGNQVDPNFGTGNTMLLQRVTAPWSHTTVGWFNQPAATTTNQLVVPHTNQRILDLDLDVTSLVNDMVQFGNNGFLMQLQSEVYYNSRIFASSKHATASKHPKLVVNYSIP